MSEQTRFAIPDPPDELDVLVLKGELRIFDNDAEIDYGFGRRGIGHGEFMKTLITARLTWQTGTCQFTITQEGVSVNSFSGGRYTQEEWGKLCNSLLEVFKKDWVYLADAWFGLPNDPMIMKKLTETWVGMLLAGKNGLLSREQQFPTLEQIIQATFEEMSPDHASGIEVWNGCAVKVNAEIRSERVFVQVGYLHDENPFRAAFHAKLIENCKRCTNPKFIKEVLRRHAVSLLINAREMAKQFELSWEGNRSLADLEMDIPPSHDF